MSYDSHTKIGERGSVHGFYVESKGRILYLDDENGCATKHFLLSNVPPCDLVPVNQCADACRTIKRRMKVDAVCDDIDHYINSLPDDDPGFSVIWLDYMCRTIKIDVIRRALELSSTVVKVTLSLRGATKGEVMTNANRIVTKCGGVIIDAPVQYQGKSDIKNMVRFTIAQKKEKKETKEMPRPPGRAPNGKIWNGFDWTMVMKPRPPGRTPNGKIWNGVEWVMEETIQEKRHKIALKAVETRRRNAASQRTIAKKLVVTPPTASPSTTCKKRRLDMHGMNVFIPISDLKGRRVPGRLNPVKITRNCLTFRVASSPTPGSLLLHGVLRNGRESSTVAMNCSVDNALRYALP
tara:strand:- start:1407 stop:2459 length:1053 start_codon:yes stop_codon:yes gene_type:complete